VLRRSSVAGLFLTVVWLAPSCTAAPPVVGSVWNVEPPPFAARADYQLGGPYPPEAGVRIVVRDRTADPAEGLYNVCYINAFQAQPGEESNWKIDGDDLTLRDQSGHQVVDRDWDEVLLDTSSPARRSAIARVVAGWIADCGRPDFVPSNSTISTPGHARMIS
jgi:hypothetical protein